VAHDPLDGRAERREHMPGLSLGVPAASQRLAVTGDVPGVVPDAPDRFRRQPAEGPCHGVRVEDPQRLGQRRVTRGGEAGTKAGLPELPCGRAATEAERRHHSPATIERADRHADRVGGLCGGEARIAGRAPSSECDPSLAAPLN